MVAFTVKAKSDADQEAAAEALKDALVQLAKWTDVEEMEVCPLPC